MRFTHLPRLPTTATTSHSNPLPLTTPTKASLSPPPTPTAILTRIPTQDPLLCLSQRAISAGEVASLTPFPPSLQDPSLQVLTQDPSLPPAQGPTPLRDLDPTLPPARAPIPLPHHPAPTAMAVHLEAAVPCVHEVCKLGAVLTIIMM